MSDDAGTEQEPRSQTGEVEPPGPGTWLEQGEAAARLKIQPKAVYRRVKRGQMIGKRDPGTGVLLVWFPTAEEHGPLTPPEEPRSLAVPDAQAALARFVEQATAPLVARIEELIRENERLRLEAEQRSPIQEQEPRSRWEELRSLIRRWIG